MKRWIPLVASLSLGACGTKSPEAPTKTQEPAIEGEALENNEAPAEAEAQPEEGALKAAPQAEPEVGDSIVKDTPADVAAPPADALKTESGLAYKILKKVDGDAPRPEAADTVEVFYSGWTTDGKNFDSRIAPAPPISFPLNAVIPGWTEGLQLMKEGERARLWIPKELAYNDMPGRPAGMLVFDVELVNIKAAPKAPADVAAPPADALKTESGLAYKVLEAGKGGDKPSATSTVTVHYSGWTTDGKLFDSSVTRGQPASFPLNRVIAGWTEGVQLMDPGSKFRFWIPEELAYKGQPGAPAGTLVFDVELLSIQ